MILPDGERQVNRGIGGNSLEVNCQAYIGAVSKALSVIYGGVR